MDSIGDKHRNGNIETCTGNTTSESTILTPGGAEEDSEFTSESTMALDDDAKSRMDDDAKSPSRSSRASRQTVQDLEAKAHKSGDKKSMMHESLIRVSTQPGAVAMYQSESGPSSSSAAPSERQDSSTNCRPLGEEESNDIPMIHVELAVDPASTPMMIQAELAEDPPATVIAIPEAQLVPPPQEAYHVQFDEETRSPLEMAQRPSTTNDGELDDLPWKTKSLWEKHGKPFFRLGVLLLVVGLIAGIVIPRFLHEEEDDHMDDSDNAVLWWEMLPGDPTPSTSHQTVYDCYDSTLKITLAQADNPTKTQFIICPNTLIPLGNLNEDREIESGDYPLTVLGNNIEIRCGLNGRRENHCILEGGFVQVLLQPSLPDLLAVEWVNRTDNVIFRGITFKGELMDGNGMMGGVSVLAENPGQNITFVDCAWENISAPSSLVQFGDVNDAMTFAPTTHVTFEDCTFSDSAYIRPLIGVYGQGVTLRRCLFEDLSQPLVMEQPY